MIYVLDAAALLNNDNFSFEKKGRYFTTSAVFAEWRDFRSKALAENALSQGLLTIQDACPLSVQKSAEKAEQSGTELSEPDLSLIALASEFAGRGEKLVVITDDYSVQNVLKKMGVKFEGVRQKGIKRHRNFKKKEKSEIR